MPSIEERFEELIASMLNAGKKSSNKDLGHLELLKDIKSLAEMALNYEFHDFKNKKFATPKVALRNILKTMESKVIDGSYDNDQKLYK